MSPCEPGGGMETGVHLWMPRPLPGTHKRTEAERQQEGTSKDSQRPAQRTCSPSRLLMGLAAASSSSSVSFAWRSSSAEVATGSGAMRVDTGTAALPCAPPK